MKKIYELKNQLNENLPKFIKELKLNRDGYDYYVADDIVDYFSNLLNDMIEVDNIEINNQNVIDYILENNRYFSDYCDLAIEYADEIKTQYIKKYFECIENEYGIKPTVEAMFDYIVEQAINKTLGK